MNWEEKLSTILIILPPPNTCEIILMTNEPNEELREEDPASELMMPNEKELNEFERN